MIYYVQVFLKSFLMHGVGVSFLLGYLLSNRCNAERLDGWAVYLARGTQLLYLVSLFIALHYLSWPSYLDHVEASVAVLGLKLRSGMDLYPSLNAYTLHGLLYGPLLAEIQAIVQSLPFDALVNSKIPGIFSFLFLCFCVFTLVKNPIALGYFLVLLTFFDFTYWNRAEPIFLLIGLLAWIVIKNQSCWRIFLLGVLAGASSSLKLHGMLYVLPFFCLLQIKNSFLLEDQAKNFALMALGCALSLGLCFAPSSVSIINFINYIRLASYHGLLPELVITNVMFGLILFFPIGIAAWSLGQFSTAKNVILLGCIFLCVQVVAVIGGKNGSGSHHLLPFVLVGACYFEMNNVIQYRVKCWLLVSFMFLALYLVIGPLPRKIQREIQLEKQSSLFLRAREEVVRSNERYGHVLMGVSNYDALPYALTYNRVLLEGKGSEQIDVTAFIDISFAGGSDKPLVNTLNECSRVLLIPKEGIPFSILNPYDGKYLFSDDLQKAFALKYKRIEHGELYDIYKCTSN
jgi:hypothetical protein